MRDVLALAHCRKTDDPAREDDALAAEARKENSLRTRAAPYRSRRLPRGKTGIMSESTHDAASRGSMPQPVGHMERISMKEYPFLSTWLRRPFMMALLVRRMFLTRLTAQRSMKTGASRVLSSSQARMGKPDLGRIPAVRRGLCLLRLKRGGRHLPAGHAVDGVVHEDDGDLLPAVGGVDCLRGADGQQIPIPLVGDDDGLRDARA